MKYARYIAFTVAVVLSVAVVSCTLTKTPNAPNDENTRYIYVTCWPDEVRLTVVVEFNDGTPTFHDERTTREHEPISYSIDRRKVKTVTIKAEKYGWLPQTKKWDGEVPFDVFIKLEERL